MKQLRFARIPWSNIIIALLSLIFVIMSCQVLLPPVNNEKSVSLTDGWTYTTRTSHEPTPVTLPSSAIVNPIGGEVTLTRKLPDEFETGASVLIRTTHQTLHVTLDGEELAEFGIDRNPPIGRSFGFAWHIVRLPTDYMGKEIAISINSSYPLYSSIANEVYFGTKSAHLFRIMTKYSVGVFTGSLLVVISVIAIVFYMLVRKLTKKNGVIVSLAVFSLFSGIWILSENRFVQLLVGMPLLQYNLGVIMLMLLPLPLLSFFSTKYIFGANKVVRCLLHIHRGFVMVALLVCMLHMMNFYIALNTYHIVLFTEGVILMILCLKEWRRTVCRVAFVGLLIFLASGVAEGIMYYFNPIAEVSRFLQFGLLAFTIIMIVNASKHVAQSSRDSLFSSALTQLAYTDTMTGLKNRTAFQQQFDALEKEDVKLDNVAIAVADLNYLKMINDNMGHKKGDDMIILCADTLLQAFGRVGSVYRIGGDEYAVIMTDVTSVQCNEALNAFKRLVKQYNKFSQKSVFSVAIGLELFNHAYDSNINDLFSRADSAMYNNKVKIKANFKFPVQHDDKPIVDDRIVPMAEEIPAPTDTQA